MSRFIRPPLLLAACCIWLTSTACPEPKPKETPPKVNEPSPEQETTTTSTGTQLKEQHREKQALNALEAATKSGAVLSEPYALEHHFIAQNEKAAQALIDEARGLGYESSELEQRGKHPHSYFYFDLKKSVALTKDNVLAESGRAAALGEKHDVLYRGWGELGTD